METSPPTLTACPECDLLVAVPELGERERADCPRCNHLLTQHPGREFQRSTAFAIAACVFLLISLFYPFMAFSSSGLENVMTLPGAVLSIYQNQSPALSAILLVAIIIAPAILLGTLLALNIPLLLEKPAGWLKPAGKLIFTLNDWSMVQVFLIAVLVSLVKIANLATANMGWSVWSYALFTVCLTAALSGLDRILVWSAIEKLSR